jgi:glutamine synthetase
VHRDDVPTDSFVARHGLRSSSGEAAARQVLAEISNRKLQTVRFAFPDQHGLLRGKTLLVSEVARALHNGVTIPTTMLAKDTAHRTVFPVFTSGGGFDMPEMQGASDMLMVPDPTTFRVLPWASESGWLLCDAFFLDGRPVPFATRQILRRALDDLGAAGHDLIVGLEVEFHVYRIVDPRLKAHDIGQPGTPPDVEPLSHGHQYLTEIRFDQIEPVVELLRAQIAALGLPLRSLEVEYGPSQFEFTFAPMEAMESADAMVLFRNAVKQICRRHGYHATFMCRPKLANSMSSGWHLHQSLRSRKDGRNALAGDGPDSLSPLGRCYLAGLLAHARASAAFCTPTINGYKRYRPYSLAPDRVTWGRDNRGSLIRVVDGLGSESIRFENRIGEPAANPYLYFSSQVFTGLDGIRRQLDPGPPADAPYEAKAPTLPRTLNEALTDLKSDACLREAFGEVFVDYFIAIKRAELNRFELDVTDWEHREYFELF